MSTMIEDDVRLANNFLAVFDSHRRRRMLIIATATLMVSSPTACSALGSNRYIYSSKNQRQFMSSWPSSVDAQSSPRSSKRFLNMVVFLEAPTTATDNNFQQTSRTGSRERNNSSKDSRKYAVVSPELASVDMDNFVTSSTSLTKPSDIILSPLMHKESIINEPDITVIPAESVENEETNSDDRFILYSGVSRSPRSNMPVSVLSLDHNTNMIRETSMVSRSLVAKNRSKTKFSTMPGFIRAEVFDEYINNRSTKMLASRHQLSRVIRSKTAKLKRRQANSEAMYKKSSSVPDSLLDYTQEIHAVSRVSPMEEIELGTKTQEAMRLQKMFEDLQAKHGREPTDDEWCAAAGKINMEALTQALNDGVKAKNQLVASNLRMVQRVVNVYIRNGLGSEYNAGDLMQDGTMALIHAAEKYEPQRGFRFSTYAMYWIRSAVKRSQTMQSRIVNVPQRIHETYKRVNKMQSKLRRELGREPTKNELAVSCEITIVQLDRCRRAMRQAAFSLDAEVTNPFKPDSISMKKNTMYDIIASQVDETEHEKTQQQFMKDHLINTLKRYLSPHEVDLLLLRYGLMDERALPKGMLGPLTIAEVSNLVGLKPDKVRRMIMNSQKQLRHLMKEWEDFEYEVI